MVDQRIIAALQHEDPARRRKAITAAAKSSNPDYLPALAQVYRTDPDADLRELARRAGDSSSSSTPLALTCRACRSAGTVSLAHPCCRYQATVSRTTVSTGVPVCPKRAVKALLSRMKGFSNS